MRVGRAALGLTLVVAGGAALRLWDLGQIFIFPDEVLWAYYPYRLHVHPVWSWPLMDNPIAQLLRWKYGYYYMTFLYLYTRFLSVAGIPASEFWLVLPVALFGSASLILVYLLGRELMPVSRPGLQGPLLIAILPLHVGLSRTMEVNRIPASFLLLLTLYLFARYFREPSRRRALWASGSLALYLVSHLESLGMLPLLVAAGLIVRNPGPGWGGVGVSWAHRLADLRSLLLRPAVLVLPAVTFFPNVLVLLYTIRAGKVGGFLGYMLTRPKRPGFHLGDVVQHTFVNVGPALVLVCLLGLAYGLWRLLRGEKEGILLCCAVIYLAPFVVLVSEEVTGTREYLIHGTIPLVMLGASALEGLFVWAAVRTARPAAVAAAAVAVAGLLAIPTLLETARLVLKVGPDGLSRVPRYTSDYAHDKFHVFGSRRHDNGIKAAGFLVREQVPPAKQVFLDMSPLHGAYYLGRPVFAIYDARLPEILEYLREVLPEVDYAIMNASHAAAFEAALPAGSRLRRAVEITTGGEVVMIIYAAEQVAPRVLSTEQLNPVFDRKYGWAGRLVTEWGDGTEVGPPVLGPRRELR